MQPSPVRFDPYKSAWLWSMGLAGLLFGRPTPGNLALAAALTCVTVCLGHSVGVHRGIIHRTYTTSPFVRGLGAWLMVLTGLGGPLSWVRLHYVRDYWQNREDCPAYFAYDHSLWRDAWWNLHLRWAGDAERGAAPEELLADPWLRFLERTWPAHILAMALVLLPFVGPGGVAVAVCGRVAVTILGHWYVGYLAHTVGEQPYVLDGANVSGTNLPLLGVLSFGEGFHNNHHAFPGSARMGLGARELDAGWWALLGLERLGLVWDLRSAERNPETRRENAHPV